MITTLEVKTISKKLVSLAASAGYVSRFLTFLPYKKCCLSEINFLTLNNYPELHHLQEDMKFATHISPLLNYYLYKIGLCLCITEMLIMAN